MRKRRALFCAALACFICLGISCPASASGVLIDDLPIDPWGELGEILGNGQIGETSLSDKTAQRYVSIFGTFRIGRTSSDNVIVPDISSYSIRNWANRNFYLLYTQSYTDSSRNVYIAANQGTYVDFWTEVNYADSSTQSIFIDGSDSCIRFYNVLTCYIVPDEVQLLINGQPAQYSNQESITILIVASDGTFTISDFHYPLTNGITSIGFRFLFTREHTGGVTYNSDTSVPFQIFVLDNTAVTVGDTPATPDPDPDPDNPGGDTEEDEQKGLLRSILDAIANIGQTILNGIKGLFVPDQEDITEIKDKYQTLLQERLGFVYEGYTMLSDGFTTLRDSMGDGEEYTFHFPGVQLPYQGETLTIIEEQDVDLDNGVFQVLRPVLGTIVSLIAVVGVVKVCFRVVSAIISGVSFFQFQSSSDGGDED